MYAFVGGQQRLLGKILVDNCKVLDVLGALRKLKAADELWLVQKHLLSVSWYESEDEVMAVIIVVRQLPPRLPCRMRVSLLSRYGTW